MAWAPDYASAADLKAFLRVTDTVDDAQIALAITAASRAIDRHTNRQFGQLDAPELRHYPLRYDRRGCRWVIETDDFMTTVGMQVELGGVTLTGVTPRPRNAAQLGRPYTELTLDSLPAGGDEAEVTIQWGWSAVPTPVNHATLLQGSRFMARRESPFGVAGSPELGSELRLLARLDPDVAVSLGPFVRWWGAA